MIVGLAFLTIQHLDFTPPPQTMPEEDLVEEAEVLHPEAQSEQLQHRDISILESNTDQTGINSDVDTESGNRAESGVVQDSLYLSQFGAQ